MPYTRSGAILAILVAAVWGAPAARADWSGTLQSLNAIAPLTVGNATYSAFTVGGDLASSDIIATITSDPAGDSSITFTVNGGNWTSNNANSLANDASTLVYSVSFSQPVTAVGLQFSAQTSGDAAGVGETVTNPALPDPLPSQTDNKHTSLQVLIGLGSDSYSQTLPLYVPASTLDIVKSIDIYGSDGTATIFSATNTYYTPEPASLGVLGIGALALMRRRR